jgi:hypothetical protein
MIKISPLIIAMALSIATSAQKLPQTQTAGVWTPQNIKIDGMPDEWRNFQAYNKAANIFYTLSNDDGNLYLAVQATDPVIINKITTSGITLTLEKPDNTTSVTFPAYDKENKAIFYIMLNAPKLKSANRQTFLQIDTFILSHNQLRAARQKIIRIAHNATEQNISVYNDEGIKVAGRIANNLSYTQELAVPLKYLGIKSGESFNYTIQLNGQIPKGATMVTIPGRPEFIVYKGADGTDFQVGRNTNPDDLTLAYPTNFKATYTMARK